VVHRILTRHCAACDHLQVQPLMSGENHREAVAGAELVFAAHQARHDRCAASRQLQGGTQVLLGEVPLIDAVGDELSRYTGRRRYGDFSGIIAGGGVLRSLCDARGRGRSIFVVRGFPTTGAACSQQGQEGDKDRNEYSVWATHPSSSDCVPTLVGMDFSSTATAYRSQLNRTRYASSRSSKGSASVSWTSTANRSPDSGQ